MNVLTLNMFDLLKIHFQNEVIEKRALGVKWKRMDDTILYNHFIERWSPFGRTNSSFMNEFQGVHAIGGDARGRFSMLNPRKFKGVMDGSQSI
jgi:hypothetical protein